jgi:hypothetical protein
MLECFDSYKDSLYPNWVLFFIWYVLIMFFIYLFLFDLFCAKINL